MPLYYFSYNVRCESTSPNKIKRINNSKFNNFYIIIKNSTPEAANAVEDYISKRILYTGNLKDYNISLVKEISDCLIKNS